MDSTDKKRFILSLLVPSILLMLIWAIWLLEYLTHQDFSGFGLLPQHFSGLKGIIFSPFLHASFAHIAANSIPLFVLSAGLFYFYEKLAYRILILLWVITGFWVWIFAKDTGIHIGASGIVYALAGFHFMGGVLRKEARLMAFSLLVVFLYGGLIWGIIPDFFPEKNISWESHLLGLLAGVIIAIFYRSYGPQPKEYHWDEEDDEPDQEPPAISETEPSGDDTATPLEETTATPPLKIIYHLRKDETNP
jgi:membrane associated rhomboid family serine protease